MRSMFYNYDNNIDRDIPKYPQPVAPLKPLMSAPNASFLYSIDEKPLGIEVKQGTSVSLYFNVQESRGTSLAAILAGAQLKFQLIGVNHKVILEKILAPEAAMCTPQDLVISLSAAETAKLRKESYNIKLDIEWPDESYALYTEKDGLLVIR